MRKNFFVAALALIALTSIAAQSARAQSCPIGDTFGTRPVLAVNKTLQSQMEVTYFTTDDPNAFISEKAGLNRSASYLNMSTNQFVARLDSLQRDGLASIKQQRSATSFLGEIAEVNLESNSARLMNASHASRKAGDLKGLERKTEVNVYEARAIENGYYRVSLLSWFVDAAAGQNTVDYDAIVLLKPGQTAIFKLGSNYEIKRNGAARSYVAVTMRSVNNVGVASLRRP